MMNEHFLQEKNIRFVVNTAKGLEIFGPKYSVRKCMFSQL